jgi:ADP-heptose:LPS heptosyltransferase
MDDNNYFANNIVNKGFNWLRAKQSNIQINNNSKILIQSKIQNQNRNAYAQVGELVELLGCTTNCWQTKLSISQEQKNKIFNDVNNFFGTKTKNLIAFHPGSSSVEKNYDIEKWADIINKIIIKSNSRILIFIGPNEKKYLSAINLLFDRNKIMLIEKEIIESIAYLSICNLFLGHDTGFAHISSSLAIPSILLYGASSRKHWEPPISTTNIIRVNNLQDTNDKDISEKVLNLSKNIIQ